MLRRFVPDMQDLFAQLERQLGEGDVEGSAATLHTIGQRFHRWRQRLAGRASELEQALRRADPLRGMEILAGIRLDELRTLCDAPAPPAGDVRRRAAESALNPRRGGQSRQGFRRTRGSPASAAACRANNAMGVIRRYS